MNVKLRKAINDLTTNPKKAVLVIFALSLGIWGVGTVLVSYNILTHDLNQNYQSTAPPHVIFHAGNFKKSDLGYFKKNQSVESAEFRDFSLHRIEVRPGYWIPLWLYGVDNPEHMQLAKFFPQRGLKIPDYGTILLERDGLNVSDIQPGDCPQLRVGDRVIKVKVSGICFDPAQAPATQDAFIYAYTDQQSYSAITHLPLNQRLLVRLKHVQSKTDVEEISKELKRVMASEGVNITSVEIPKFNEHPHQWQLNTLLFLIGTIGFLAFAMGSVLVSQLIRSILSSQVRQIGILRSLGATRGQVLSIYLFMLFTIGLLSGCIAIPLAVETGFEFSRFVAGKLNFDLLTQTLPASTYVYLVGSSVVLPVLLSLPMLLKGTSVSVKDAVSDYGLLPQSSGYQFEMLNQLSWSYSSQLAFRNSLRNTKRSAVTILAMAFGVAIFDTGFNTRQSLWELLSGLKQELRYDAQVVLARPVTREEALQPFKHLQNVDEIETWVGGRGEIQSKVIGTDKGSGIVAVPVTTSYLKLRLVKGRWITSSAQVEVVLNQQAQSLYNNSDINSTIDITIDGKTIKAKVVGIAEQFEKPKLYMDIVTYDSLVNPKHLINTINFRAQKNDLTAVSRLKEEIEKSIVPSKLEVLFVMSQAERVKIIYDHLDIILSVIIILSFLVLTVSAVGMASATGINIWERTREIGVMRAIGATPEMIYRLFVMEGVVTSVISILLGLVLAYPLSKLAATFFGQLMLGESANLQYAFSPLGFGITALVTFVFGLLASRIPARSAIQVSTQQALSYE